MHAGDEVTCLMDPVKLNVTQKLRQNYKTIDVKYASYVSCVRKSLKAKKVEPDDLCADLLSLGYFKSNKMVANELKNAKTINEIFIVLTSKVCSFWDYDIFEFIVSEYDLDESREKLQYSKHFESYIQKHKVSEFVAVNPLLAKHKVESEDSKELALKFDLNIVDCSLDQIDKLKNDVATLLKIESSTLRLISIEEGCMEVTYLIPATQADVIFTREWKTVSERAKSLKDASVVSVTCNNSTFNTKEGILTTFAKSKEKFKVLEATKFSKSERFAS